MRESRMCAARGGARKPNLRWGLSSGQRAQEAPRSAFCRVAMRSRAVARAGDQVIREDPAGRRSEAGAPKHRQRFLSPTCRNAGRPCCSSRAPLYSSSTCRGRKRRAHFAVLGEARALGVARWSASAPRPHGAPIQRPAPPGLPRQRFWRVVPWPSDGRARSVRCWQDLLLLCPIGPAGRLRRHHLAQWAADESQ